MTAFDQPCQAAPEHPLTDPQAAEWERTYATFQHLSLLTVHGRRRLDDLRAAKAKCCQSRRAAPIRKRVKMVRVRAEDGQAPGHYAGASRVRAAVHAWKTRVRIVRNWEHL